MHRYTIAFAAATPKSHIAIVDDGLHQTLLHFAEAQRQLRGVLEHVSGSRRVLYLTNGTMLHFIPATGYQYLQGLRLDRIDTSISAVSLMPDNFLAWRLKPGVMPCEGIIYRESE